MPIRRSPKPPKFKRAKKDPNEDPTKRRCAGCGQLHTFGQAGTYVMSSMLDPTEYACSKPCFERWYETHPPEVWPTRNAFGNCA